MFSLDPESVVGRARAAQRAVVVPRLWQSALRGMLGFTVVSLGGFGPWVLGSGWFQRHGGELFMYGVCAACFIGLSGVMLRGLIIGPGSLRPFYQVFGLGFGVYAVGWTAAWMLIGGDIGGVVGLLVGTAGMGAVMTLAFQAPRAFMPVVVVLFTANALGYFGGGWAHTAILNWQPPATGDFQFLVPWKVPAAKTVWGIGYGMGFGLGIGLAFHFCQHGVRCRLLTQQPQPMPLARPRG